MFEQQRKMENDKSNASLSNHIDPSSPSEKSKQQSPKNEKPEAAELDLTQTGTNTGNVNATFVESPQNSSKKQKSPETDAVDLDDDESSHTNTKRARMNDTAECSVKSASD